jgi:hypothetical protein
MHVRWLMTTLALASAIAAAPAPAMAQTTAVNTTVFPLSGNLLFPARAERRAIRCQNAKTNHVATITYPSGFVFTLEPGGSLWELNIGTLGGNWSVADPARRAGVGPNGAIHATGTAGETLNCEETYWVP